jgi:small subunit ribosomal protein S6
MFIVDPTLPDEEIGSIQQRLRELAESRGAEVKKMEPWERRRLAYEIKGRRDGVYILAQILGEPSAVKELEQQLAVTETVLRHMVVRLDED